MPLLNRTAPPFETKPTESAPTQGAQNPEWRTMTYRQRLEYLIAQGWEMKSEGPSGAQLVGEKKMRTLDRICLWLGILTVVFYGVGLIFIIIAMIDYAFFTERAKYFLPNRDAAPAA